MDADGGDEIFTLFGAHVETALAETLPKAAGCCLSCHLDLPWDHEESISVILVSSISRRVKRICKTTNWEPFASGTCWWKDSLELWANEFDASTIQNCHVGVSSCSIMFHHVPSQIRLECGNFMKFPHPKLWKHVLARGRMLPWTYLALTICPSGCVGPFTTGWMFPVAEPGLSPNQLIFNSMVRYWPPICLHYPFLCTVRT